MIKKYFSKNIKLICAITIALTYSTSVKAIIHLPPQNYVNTVRNMDFYSNKPLKCLIGLSISFNTT